MILKGVGSTLNLQGLKLTHLFSLKVSLVSSTNRAVRLITGLRLGAESTGIEVATCTRYLKNQQDPTTRAPPRADLHGVTILWGGAKCRANSLRLVLAVSYNACLYGLLRGAAEVSQCGPGVFYRGVPLSKLGRRLAPRIST